MSLFDQLETKNRDQAKPLAARMRPRSLAEFVGQRHILGEGKLLRRLLDADRLGSVIFYGPPGTGKTTLARLLAHETKAAFHQLSAVTSGVKDIRQTLAKAADELAATGNRTLLFVDEIHRFNKSQQDALLHDVEEGVVTLVGATTSNPFFAINSALVSRSTIFEFQPLSNQEIKDLLQRALKDPNRGLASYRLDVSDEALEYLAANCDGDARRALYALEIAVLSNPQLDTNEWIRLGREQIAESIQRKSLEYDATGDTHYDCTSALIKSMRGSDPDASVYWLARMLESGEDVRFLCRRIVIFASEDVGNADPHALSIAVAAMQACEFVGLPECQLTLSHAVTYLACCPKSNSATVAISEARTDIREGRVVPVPKHLRDAHYSGAKELGHGNGYIYSHQASDGIAEQEYLGIDRQYYRPTDRGHEAELSIRLQKIRQRLHGGEAIENETTP